jgi:hypothetical protein
VTQWSELPWPWKCLSSEETTGTSTQPAIDVKNWGLQRYGGYFQFTLGSWISVGGTGLPSSASLATQLEMAERLEAKSGWGNWPYTSKECGV